MTRLSLVFGLALLAAIAVAAPVPKEGSTPFIAWKVADETGRNAMNGVAVVGDIVVIGTDQGELRAYQAKDGKPLWTHSHGKRIYESPSGDRERVYFTTEDGGLTAVSLADGTLAWSFPIVHGAGPVSYSAEKNLVLVAGNDGRLCALAPKTAAVAWEADFLANAPPDPPGFAGGRARIGTKPARPYHIASDGECVYLTVFDQCRVVANDLASGKRRWSFQTRGWVGGAPVVTATHVLVGSQDKHFYCLDKATGAERWKFQAKSRFDSGGVVDEKFVYVPSSDGHLYALSIADGKVRWRFETDRRPDGRPSAIYSTPVLRSGRLHFAAGEGQFYSVAAATGELVWKMRPSKESELYCSPATDGTRFFVVPRRQSENLGESALVAVAVK